MGFLKSYCKIFFSLGYGVHPERVQRPEDHQDLLPRRLLPQEPGVGPAVRQPPARPGRGELRSYPKPRAQQRAQERLVINQKGFLLLTSAPD